MTTREVLKRYILEIQRLRKSPASWEEICHYLDRKSEEEGYDYRIETRTFKRDRDDIESLFGIEIQYDFSRRAYVIVNEERSEITERLIEAVEIFDALQMRERIEDFVQLESRRPSGTEYLYPLIKATKDQCEITFQYLKFGEKNLTERRVQPYGIKEFRNWWFLLGKDSKDGVLKNFGLDRIRELKVTKTKFRKEPSFDMESYYRDCFGVTRPANKEPQDIILAISGEEINYVKTMPYHASQEIVEEKKDRLTIKLHLYITWELVAELRSKAPYIKVIAPEELKREWLNYKYFDQF